MFQKAKELNIASIGGNAQFLFPDGIYDLYWICVNSGEQADEETWEQYVLRSNDESLALLSDQIQSVDFRKEVAEAPLVRERTLHKGLDPLDYLFYEFYFNSEAETIELGKWGKESGFYEHVRRSNK